MDITLFSLVMAALWFSVFAGLFSLCIRFRWFISHISIWFPVLLGLLCVLRAVLPVEFPSAVVIHSYRAYPALRRFFEYTPAWSGSRMTLGRIFLLIYALIAFGLLLRLMARHLRFQRWVASLSPCRDSRITRWLEKFGKDLIPARVYQDSRIAAPYTGGLLRPVFLMPAYELTEEQIGHILAHESMHFRRRDLWAKLALNVFVCLLWWNPLVYLLKNNFDHFLEVKCDRLVVEAMTEEERSDYYLSILDMYRRIKGSKEGTPAGGLGLVSIRSERQLIQRFRCGLEYQPGHHAAVSLLSLLCTLLLLFSSYAFILQPVEAPKEESGLFDITVENAYLIDNQDGTFSLYTDGELRFVIDDAAMLESEPFTDLSILKGETP